MSVASAARGERHWMEQALALGALGEEATSPNPRVGCVVVREGRAVGRGWHRAPGLPHAEAIALAEAGPAARGATLYVNLEPCAHVGRTPPCTDMIAQSGIRRVVAAVTDPNPLVDGRGFAALRAAGITVDVGLLARESEELNEAFLHVHRRGRPRVTLKAAVSLDGMLAAAGGRARWITGAAARRFAHRLRLRHDAVLVGAGTIRIDDPQLTVRLPGVSAERIRAVLAPELDLDPGAALFRAPGRRPRLYASAAAAAERVERLAAVADVVRVAEHADGLAIDEVLADLGRLSVQSVLVEGGARTFASFLDAGRADRMALFVAPRLVGARGATPLVDRLAADAPALGLHLDIRHQLALGPDLVLLGRLGGPADRG
jgi:diaminohydroxyphosphoribosylaminopyrimidine deaminase/5-amino-6-(5-phosphoribosylamino)uracil reductase